MKALKQNLFPAKLRPSVWTYLTLALLALVAHSAPAASRPNVIVILADDLGYHDLGVQGATDVKTPNLDALARNGVRFTSGYVTAPLCSPSRAGLITGRYQQRFGHETNPGLDLERNPLFGLPLTESTIANRIKPLGYATGWIGKSHLGGDLPYHPLERGFDEFFGFIEGHHEYLAPGIPTNQVDPILRGHTIVPETNYLTYAFAREITNFVSHHAAEPFFIYAPFNAVHTPLEATPELLSRFSSTNFTDPQRYIMAAVLAGLDDAVGLIVRHLRTLNLETNTLIFFTSDNGGPTPGNGSLNIPLRGYKTQPYEGGVRVPFLLQWPGTLPSNTVYQAPVSTLDILPTAIAAAGGTSPAAWQLDGVNLLPYLLGQNSARPHTNLFWRIETNGADSEDESTDGARGVRQDDWKLVKFSAPSPWELYDLATDIGETNNLAEARPDIVQRLVAAFEEWETGLAPARWAYNALPYERAPFVPEDIRIGDPNVAYSRPAFLPDSARFAFVDPLHGAQLWTGELDLDTGFLRSADGRDQQADAGVTSPTDLIEGPQWGVDASSPALFYTKADGSLHQQAWRTSFDPSGLPLPQVVTSGPTDYHFNPRPSQNPGAATTYISFRTGSSAAAVSQWADFQNPGAAQALPNHLGGTDSGRWLPGSRDLAYAGSSPVSVHPQIILLETASSPPRLITNEDSDKTDVWGFLAPEFNGERCYAAIVDGTNVAIYRNLQSNTNGIHQRVATLSLPADAPHRYLRSLRPVEGQRGFNGVSYFVCTAHANSNPASPGDSGIWLFGLGPDTNNSVVRRLDQSPRVTSNAPTVLTPGRHDPHLVPGTRELWCYYSLDDTSGATQLRLARTGIRRPEHFGDQSGFARLALSSSHESGHTDGAGRWMSATETLRLTAHQGRLFAGTGSREFRPYPTNPSNASPTWTGAQILVKDSAAAEWRVDAVPAIFRGHLRVETLESITLTTRANGAAIAPTNLLIAGLSDISTGGANLASVRTRVEGPAEGWQHSHVADTLTPANVVSFGTHVDRSNGVHLVFAGLENGEIYRGAFNPNASGYLSWASNNVELTGAGPVTGFAECQGRLYAAASLNADGSAGGLYLRRDGLGNWIRVYAWNRPAPLSNAPASDRQMLGLTTVLDPMGSSNQVLLTARAWPGVIERIDPSNRFAVTLELDVREFFARQWNDDRIRTQNVTVAYTGFTPVVDPATGERVHLVGVRLERPGASGEAIGESQYLIRHRDATYEAATLPAFSRPNASDAALRATRCIAPSPFPEDRGQVWYFGGYDTGTMPSTNTAWIAQGRWEAWPALTMSRPNPPDWQLNWPVATTNWVLESTALLGDGERWQTVPGLPTRSVHGQSQAVPDQPPFSLYRLRRP